MNRVLVMTGYGSRHQGADYLSVARDTGAAVRQVSVSRVERRIRILAALHDCIRQPFGGY